MQLFIEQLLNGIATGSIYALVTLGLALVYGIMRILHVAHAAVFTIGAYVGLLFLTSPAASSWPSWGAWPSVPWWGLQSSVAFTSLC
jgi:branched-subunit amino acid ABC-type transport system permease component